LLAWIKTANKVTGFVGGFLGTDKGSNAAHRDERTRMGEVCGGCFDFDLGDFPVFYSPMTFFVT